VHRSALAQAATGTTALADGLDDLDATDLVTEHAHRIALALREWQEGRLSTVAAQVAPLSGGLPPDEAEHLVARAERAAMRAGAHLDRLESWLLLLAATHDAEVLDGRSAASHARLERAFAVLRARRAWLDPRVEVGLRRAIFRGVEPAGASVVVDISMPRIANEALPEVGKENYAVRWKGELRIPKGKGWHFGLEVDDGARVTVDGKRIIDGESWQEQGPTTYVGAIERQGQAWLPIEIEYFQARGGAALRCWLQRDAKRTELDGSMLRHRTSADLVASMLRLSPDQVARACLAAAEEMADLQAAPKRADKLALEGGANRIHGRVRDLREALKRLEELRQADLAAHGQTELASLAGGYGSVPGVTADTAKELRRLLDARAKQLTPAEEGLGRLAERAQAIRMDLEPMRRKREREKLAASGDLGLLAEDLRAEAEVLGSQLRRAQRAAHEGARAAASGVAERLRQVELEVGLAELVHRDLAQLEEHLDAVEHHSEAADGAVQAAAALRDGLRRMAKVEAALTEARLAGDARDALAADDRVRTALAKDRAAEAALSGAERNEQLSALGDDLRRSGRSEAGERIHEAARDTATDAALERLSFTTDLDLAAQADLVVECVPEDLALKLEVFRDLDARAPEDAILASNTSGFPLTAIAASTSRPGRVVIWHWASPPPVMKFAEIVRTPRTEDAVVDTVCEVARACGKNPVVIEDAPMHWGFVANRIYGAMLREAGAVVAEGVATHEQVDQLMVDCFDWPVGPFAMVKGATSGWKD